MEVWLGLQAHEPVKECSFLPTEGDDMWEAGFYFSVTDQACHQSLLLMLSQI